MQTSEASVLMAVTSMVVVTTSGGKTHKGEWGSALPRAAAMSLLVLTRKGQLSSKRQTMGHIGAAWRKDAVMYR